MSARIDVHKLHRLLGDGPMSLDEIAEALDARPADVRYVVERYSGDEYDLLHVDPDPHPDEFVPGNPMIVRQRGDKRRWPGWEWWNV